MKKSYVDSAALEATPLATLPAASPMALPTAATGLGRSASTTPVMASPDALEAGQAGVDLGGGRLGLSGRVGPGPRGGGQGGHAPVVALPHQAVGLGVPLLIGGDG